MRGENFKKDEGVEGKEPELEKITDKEKLLLAAIVTVVASFAACHRSCLLPFLDVITAAAAATTAVVVIVSAIAFTFSTVIDTVCTNLGPHCVDKMIYSLSGDVIITNNLSHMFHLQPTRKMLVEFSPSHDDVVGDVTTSIIISDIVHKFSFSLSRCLRSANLC